MEECNMTCTTCFYSQDSYDKIAAWGRDQDGKEVDSHDIFLEYCFCFAEPIPLLISEHVIEDTPDILVNPNYHRCGRGRWWSEGKWVKWFDRE